MDLTPTLLCISLVAATATMVDDQPYCTVRYRRLCMGKGRHVACQFPYPGPGESCENYTQIKFSEDMQNFVTHYINRRRQRLAAGNERVRGGIRLAKPALMMQVEWDRELATLAQRLADQCNFVHDDCRATVRYPYAGQTVGEVKWRSSENEEITAQRAIRRVLDAWWGERRRVTPQQLMAPFRLTNKGTVWGHFSQLAVWSLRAVGCAAVRHGDTHPRLLLVCDYSHTNMLGQRTISPGPLTPCPIHTVRRSRSPYPLLCTTVHHSPHPHENQHQESEQQYDYDSNSELQISTALILLSTQSKLPTREEQETMQVIPSSTARTIRTKSRTTKSKTTKSRTTKSRTTSSRTRQAATLTLPTTRSVSLTLPPITEAETEADTAHQKTSPATEMTEEPVRAVTRKTYTVVLPHDNIVRKDHQPDPLVHRDGARLYEGGFLNKIEHELEGRNKDHTQRFRPLIPEKYHIWRHTVPAYVYFRGLKEKSKSTDSEHYRKSYTNFPPQRAKTLKAPSIVQKKEPEANTRYIDDLDSPTGLRQNPDSFQQSQEEEVLQRKEIYEDQRNEIYKETTQRKEIFKDYDQRNEIYKDTIQRKEIYHEPESVSQRKYTPPDQTREIYESPVIKNEAYDPLVEIKQPYVPSLRRKDPHEAVIDLQRRKAEEKYSQYEPVQRFELISSRKNIHIPQEKDIPRSERKEIMPAPREDIYNPSQRKDMSVPRNEMHKGSAQRIGNRQKNYETVEKEDPRNQDLEIDKDNYEPPVQRKDVYEPIRQKWKQIKRRPIRPGAHALPLAMLVSNVNRPPERDSSVLKIDKDDVDQLIQDTGFNPLTNKRNT